MNDKRFRERHINKENKRVQQSLVSHKDKYFDALSKLKASTSDVVAYDIKGGILQDIKKLSNMLKYSGVPKDIDMRISNLCDRIKKHSRSRLGR